VFRNIIKYGQYQLQKRLIEEALRPIEPKIVDRQSIQQPIEPTVVDKQSMTFDNKAFDGGDYDDC